MKTTSLIITVSLLILLCTGTDAVSGQAADADTQLAKRLVQSASVRPGDVVVINGGRHMVSLMEAVAVEVQMAGGIPNMWLTSDRIQRSLYTDVPEKYLGQKTDYVIDWYKKVNVFIALPTVEDTRKLIEGVPETRIAKVNAGNDSSAEAINSLPVRAVGINYPTAADASVLGVDYPTFEKMMWAAIKTDYSAVSASGAKLRTILASGKQMPRDEPRRHRLHDLYGGRAADIS